MRPNIAATAMERRLSPSSRPDALVVWVATAEALVLAADPLALADALDDAFNNDENEGSVTGG